MASKVSVQTSPSFVAALCKRQTTVGSALGRRYSIAPRNAGTFGKSARSVRKQFISTSGFTPSSSLRYSLRKNLLSKSIEELLCSPPKTCDLSEITRSPGWSVLRGMPTKPRHQDGFLNSRKTRDDRFWRALKNCPRSVTGCNLYREGIRFRRSIKIAHFNKPKSSSISVRRDGRVLDHPKMPQGPRFGTKPAAGLDVIGQDFILELFALAIVKQGMQFCMRMDRRHQALL